MTPFIVYALPRSRTKWTSEFLAADGRRVLHDSVVTAATLEEVRSNIESAHGTVETGLAPYWRLMNLWWPMARIAVIRRPVADVLFSLTNCGLDADAGQIWEQDRALDKISAQPGVLTIRFSDLRRRCKCQSLFEWLNVASTPIGRWQEFRNVNIQIDVKNRLKILVEGADRIAKLKQEALEEMSR